jgi:magnesium-transporting ATPase (P-type)
MLSFEPKEKRIMEITPQAIREEEFLSPVMKLLIVVVSLTIGISGLIAFRSYYLASGDINLSRTLTFAILASVDLVYIFAFKNLNKLIIFTDNFFQNIPLILSVFYGFALIFLAIYVPGLNKILTTTPLSFSHWVIVAEALLTYHYESSKLVVTKISNQFDITRSTLRIHAKRYTTQPLSIRHSPLVPISKGTNLISRVASDDFFTRLIQTNYR